MGNVKSAPFNFINFTISKFSFEDHESSDNVLTLSFIPSGEYYQTEGVFKIKLIFDACLKKDESKKVISLQALTEFQFDEGLEPEEIPDYFYNNSIAIVYPYIRAFVSTMSLQANIKMLILDLKNLTGLSKPLRENTTFIK